MRNARRRQGHSLDTLAKASGVSRAMLGQIETGKSVPTITLLWKVAEALGIPVAHLISRPDTPLYHVERKAAARFVTASSGRFQRRPIAPQEEAGSASFQELRIAAGHRETVEARPAAAHISIVIAVGKVEISVESAPPVRLGEGDAIFFSATSEHVISNFGTEESILFLVLTPQRIPGR